MAVSILFFKISNERFLKIVKARWHKMDYSLEGIIRSFKVLIRHFQGP
ncbi:hypothetical protein SAMN05428962_2369 [Paenibacillus sp. BC26]|nr:hypothetical protein SAMN05428962_2369 [Paenibacillus sp. BC26]